MARLPAIFVLLVPTPPVASPLPRELVVELMAPLTTGPFTLVEVLVEVPLTLGVLLGVDEPESPRFIEARPFT